VATILVVSNGSYRGPVLLRGHRLDGQTAISFHRSSEEAARFRLPSGPWDERKPRLTAWGRPFDALPGWRVAIVNLLMTEGGCYGLQADGVPFSYAIVFSVTWQH
jgi:hypothetical protein